MRLFTLLTGILLLSAGCESKPDEQRKNISLYYDLKGYFKKEADRLNSKNPIVRKMVSVNDSPETRSLKIPDWKKELSVISDADINKTSWRGAFSMRKNKNVEVYTSDDKKIHVKQVTINYRNGKPSGFLILIRNSNTLYTSTDSISYYPDSLYRIIKTQDIRLLS